MATKGRIYMCLFEILGEGYKRLITNSVRDGEIYW